LAREALDQEERRIAEARGEAERRLHQLVQDRKREDELAADAAAALARLGEERSGLVAAQEDEATTQQAAGDRLREAAQSVAALEAEVARLTDELAAAEARRASLARQQVEAEERRRRLGERLAETARQREAVAAERPDPGVLGAAARRRARRRSRGAARPRRAEPLARAAAIRCDGAAAGRHAQPRRARHRSRRAGAAPVADRRHRRSRRGGRADPAAPARPALGHA